MLFYQKLNNELSKLGCSKSAESKSKHTGKQSQGDGEEGKKKCACSGQKGRTALPSVTSRASNEQNQLLGNRSDHFKVRYCEKVHQKYDQTSSKRIESRKKVRASSKWMAYHKQQFYLRKLIIFMILYSCFSFSMQKIKYHLVSFAEIWLGVRPFVSIRYFMLNSKKRSEIPANKKNNG